MKIDLSQFRETFLQESAEHIVQIEDGLLQLKSAGSDDETLNCIFRAAHSIKGGAGAFGLTNVVRFTHVLENLFDRMREHRVSISAELIALLLSANDALRDLIASSDDVLPEAVNRLRLALEKASSGSAPDQAPATLFSGSSAHKNELVETEYNVRLRPLEDLFGIGSDPLLLLRNMAALGRLISVKVDATALPELRSLNTENSYLAWEADLVTSASRSELDEVFEFVLDCVTLHITEQPKLQTAVRPSPAQDASPARTNAGKTETSSIRVPTEKIDKLIDLVGELVIAQSITARLVDNISPESIEPLKESVASLERHIRELHERTMSVRMLPLGSLFNRFHRLVHDLAEKTGKQIQLLTEGDGTEVDRGILEMLGDPLIHVLRNSADHGIETVSDRRKIGKNPQGTIILRASQMGGSILIEVIDDGAGLNLSRIREKAVAKNLIAPDTVLSDEQIRMLIFEPGFSTKDEVSDLSGRGVGMDVVRRNVAAINGSISLDGQQGVGTHISIQLPLTLAIIEGLIVRVETHRLIIPLVSIVETVCLKDDDIRNVAGRGEAAIVREEVVPFLRLKQVFGIPLSTDEEGDSPNGNRKLVVIVEHNDHRAALEIDEIVGQQQIVVKSLERNFTKLDGTLGATILGDGNAALILDVQAFMRRSRSGSSIHGQARLSLVA